MKKAALLLLPLAGIPSAAAAAILTPRVSLSSLRAMPAGRAGAPAALAQDPSSIGEGAPSAAPLSSGEALQTDPAEAVAVGVEGAAPAAPGGGFRSAVQPYDDVPTAKDLFLEGRFIARRKAFGRVFHLPWDQRHHLDKELDLSLRRPVVELSGDVFARRYSREGTRLYANFYHDGAFHIARVPERAVKNLYVQRMYFPPKAGPWTFGPRKIGPWTIPAFKVGPFYIAAHTLLRYELETPVELVAPMPDKAELERLRALPPEERAKALPEEYASPSRLIRNLAVSAEAQWMKGDPKGTAYHLLRGFVAAFTQIVRAVSIEEQLKEFYRTGEPIDQHVYRGKADLDALLTAALTKSQQEGILKIYDGGWYNCTTMVFDILEKVLGRMDRRVGRPLLRFFQRRIPIRIGDKLKMFEFVKTVPIQEDASLAEEHRRAKEAVPAPAGKIGSTNLSNIEAAIALLERIDAERTPLR